VYDTAFLSTRPIGGVVFAGPPLAFVRYALDCDPPELEKT
jgi:hypothetical protein